MVFYSVLHVVSKQKLDGGKRLGKSQVKSCIARSQAFFSFAGQGMASERGYLAIISRLASTLLLCIQWFSDISIWKASWIPVDLSFLSPLKFIPV